MMMSSDYKWVSHGQRGKRERREGSPGMWAKLALQGSGGGHGGAGGGCSGGGSGRGKASRRKKPSREIVYRLNENGHEELVDTVPIANFRDLQQLQDRLMRHAGHWQITLVSNQPLCSRRRMTIGEAAAFGDWKDLRASLVKIVLEPDRVIVVYRRREEQGDEVLSLISRDVTATYPPDHTPNQNNGWWPGISS